MAVDVTQVVQRRHRARRAARDDGRLGHPRGARGRAERRLPARGDRGPRARRVRGDRARDGGRRELQQRVGGARQAGVGVWSYGDHPEYGHHIGGSDASGIVWKVGAGVTRWKPGDEVVIHCNQASYEDPEVHGLDPLAAPSQKIWGYETTWGSFAQFTKVQAQQLLPKPHEPDLGGGRLLRPRRTSPPTACSSTRCNLQAGATRADLGRRRRPRRVRHAALQGGGRRVRRRRLLGARRASSSSSSAPSTTSTATSSRA